MDGLCRELNENRRIGDGAVCGTRYTSLERIVANLPFDRQWG
jgi:hypothetical protein